MNRPRADHVPAPLADPVAQAIEALCEGCAGDPKSYRRYLERTCWRVAADYAFLRTRIPLEASVLDLGAVPPLLAALLAQAGHRHITVYDPHASAFAPWFNAAKVQYRDADLLGDATLSPVPHDLVCLCEVMEHLTGDVLQVFGRIAHWVAPGGYLYVTTPNLRSVSGLSALVFRGSGLASKPRETVRQQYERASGEGGYFGHVREYTSREVIEFVSSFGFRHVASQYQAHPRAESWDRRVVRLVERALPSWRLFGKHLFQKLGD
jgi:SAM-dependent methyltransferase